MPKFDRLNESSTEIQLDFVAREAIISYGEEEDSFNRREYRYPAGVRSRR